MQKIKVLIILLFLNVNNIFSQNLYKVIQKCNTEQSISTLLKLPKDKSTMLIVYESGKCPRCEVVFNTLKSLLENHNINYFFIPNFNKITQNEIDKKIKNNTSLFLDSLGVIYKSFVKIPDYSNIGVPHIIKLSSNGKMIWQISILGLEINEKLIKTFLESEKTYDCLSDNNYKEYKLNFYLDDLIKIKKTNFSYSSFINFDTIISINRDELYIAEIESLKNQKQLLSKLPEEYSYFNKGVDEFVFKILKQNQIMRVMYLKVIDFSDGIIKIVASLPKIVKENDGYGYYNVPVFITKTIDNKLISIDSFGISKYLSSGYVYSHQDISTQDSVRCVKIIKGWPAVGTDSIPDSDPIFNLNNNLFYKNSPLYICFTPTKHFFLKELGKKEKCFKTGYYYNYNKLFIGHDSFYFTRGYNGIVEVISRKNQIVKDTIEIFKPLWYGQKQNCSNIKNNNLNNLYRFAEFFDNRIEILFFDSKSKLLYSIYKYQNEFILSITDIVYKKTHKINLSAINYDAIIDMRIKYINSQKSQIRIMGYRNSDFLIATFTNAIR